MRHPAKLSNILDESDINHFLQKKENNAKKPKWFLNWEILDLRYNEVTLFLNFLHGN